MKKFLAILLIAIVACSSVSVAEEEEFDFEKLPDWLKNGWSKVKEYVKKVIIMLKGSGYWDLIVDYLKTKGKEYAKKFCLKWYDEEFCDELIGDFLNKAGEVILKRKPRIRRPHLPIFH